ncbi:hypothetical protein C8R46DRAFT_921248 [Mycena filopes]|nr:hypothetical protein C8R46DRAFT_921248 [Mycena filopes]
MHLFPLDFTRGRIAELDADILALTQAISQIKLERKVLKKHLASYIYPVLTLPNEVVAEIFLQTLDGPSFLGGRASPIYLGHICQRWRDIALSTPSLWSGMSIIMHHFRPSQTSYLELLELWLARSRDCPLTISFTNKLQTGVGTPSLAIKAILAHQTRWDTVALDMAWDALPNIQGDLPLLRSLDIRLRDTSAAPPMGMAGSARAFSGPKLRIVILSGPKVHMLGLPWAQLTSITIETSLEAMVQILRTTSALRELSVRPYLDMRDPSYWDRLPSIPPLMHLRTLAFARATRVIPSLLRKLTLPALKHIELPMLCLPEVVEILTRSRCPLDGLQISMSGVEYLPSLQPDGVIVLEVWENEEESDESADSDESGDSEED